MSSGGKGWVGSLAVHLGLLGAVIGFSWYAARHPGESLEPVDPLLIDLSGIPGKRPGEIGKAPGVAQGAETGTNNGIARIKSTLPSLMELAQGGTSHQEALLVSPAAIGGMPLALRGGKGGEQGIGLPDRQGIAPVEQQKQGVGPAAGRRGWALLQMPGVGPQRRTG